MKRTVLIIAMVASCHISAFADMLTLPKYDGSLLLESSMDRLLQQMPGAGWHGDPETTSPEDLLEWIGQSGAFRLVQ